MTTTGDEDLTRKQRREAAREERKALEQAQAAKESRQQRLMLLGGALAAAVVIVVVLIIVSSSGSSSSKTETGLASNPSSVTTKVDNLIAGIPQSGTTLGNPNAPVTLDYYGDLECPICQEFSLNTLPTVITSLVKTGKLKVVYRNLETATQSPTVFAQQQVAAAAAGKQNKAWQYIELFYNEQGKEDSGYVNTAYLDKLAQQVPGLNLAAWQAAQNDPTLTAAVKSDETHAASLGFNSTPTLVATGPKGSKGVVGFVPYSAIQSLVQSVS
jgi:protein-disulfide isomerase